MVEAESFPVDSIVRNGCPEIASPKLIYDALLFLNKILTCVCSYRIKWKLVEAWLQLVKIRTQVLAFALKQISFSQELQRYIEYIFSEVF